MRRRGQPAGRRVQLLRQLQSADPVCLRSSSCLHLSDAVSGLTRSRSSATFACLNVRSLLTFNKLDAIQELFRDYQINVMCLVETWHDAGSVCLSRLRSAGFNIVDRPRPRVADDESCNHGGVAVVATPDVVLSSVVIEQPLSFEVVCARAVMGSSAVIVVALYRPGSVPVQQSFFDELAAVFDRVATYQLPICITGDFNVRLDRDDDPHASQLRLLVDCYGLVLHKTGPTHQQGGTLDAVITRDDVGRPDRVPAVDVGLSDHHMLLWAVDVARQASPVTVKRCRPWRRLDIEQFRTQLTSSRLRRPDVWPVNIDDTASLAR
jgi:hypothetical protein